MNLETLLRRWRADETVGPNITAWEVLPARSAQFDPLPGDLHPALQGALVGQGILALYRHQALAWQLVQAGQHLVLATGTASGKTLAYNLPVLDCLLDDRLARALYLFPTKALAQDQLNALQKLLAAGSRQKPSQAYLLNTITPAVYDGDTPTHSRPALRSKARLLISNPDMLHTGILPHHTQWAEFFGNLRYVVIDELHLYRGVFGSHVANVLRRLRRVARFYGADPQFILTSATIANPVELAEKLVEAPVALVDQDGSARGEKHFLIYNPPLVDRELGIRRSLTQECVHLAEDLYTYQVQTILFGRARRTIEIILTYLRERLGNARQGAIQEVVRGYRSGYLPRQRREIEEGLRQGQVRAVVATSALEVGVDIGQMGATVLAGYPGTITSTWQQAGRAGRGQEASLAVLVTSASPLDQFLAHHPEYFFGRTPEQALVNPDNLLILLGHLRCAAFELPFRHGENFGSVNPKLLAEFLSFLQQEGVLHESGGRYFWMSDAYPAQAISLRSASPEIISLLIENDANRQTIGQVDRSSAAWMVHPGAVYLHEGQTYLVEALDFSAQCAYLRPAVTDYYTEPLRDTQVQIQAILTEAKAPGCGKAHGEITVTTLVTGFRKIRWGSHENIGAQPLDLPPSTLETSGYWFSLSQETVEALAEAGLWNDAPNDYGPEWNKLREQVRQRDGYRCQVCGLAEQEKAHHVHHKQPFRSFTSMAEAHRLENLVTLCPACHRQAETIVRVRSGLAGTAYALANLAPLFVMCDAHDLGVHNDPQSPLADGNPVIVIYDQVPAGIGLSERLYELHNELVRQARALVQDCACSDGCPSCVGPGGENGYGGKREALALLTLLSGNEDSTH